ncbi:ribosome silencing factor [Granulosicoccus sp. 3-233]|uniref:ribosome silencing factor n=1 Tax=Granulosicoccus sp. 3-233 TaxID=3417969 RepID=UPI003D339710
MNSEAVIEMAVKALEDMKGVDLTVIDIVGKSSIADAMIVVTGTSQRHVRSMAETVRLAAKEAGHPPLGVEGGDSSDWVLVDLGDVIVHVMTEEKREFYSLEKLWSVGPAESGEAADDGGSATAARTR